MKKMSEHLAKTLVKIREENGDQLKKQIDALKEKIKKIKDKYPEGTHIDKFNSGDYLNYSDLVKKKITLQDKWEKLPESSSGLDVLKQFKTKPSSTLDQELKGYSSQIKKIAAQIESLATEVHDEDPAYGDVMSISDAIYDIARNLIESNNANEALTEELTGDALLAKVAKIADEHQAAKIDGVLVDASTANLIVQIANGLKPENKEKFLGKGIRMAAKVAWSLAK